MRWEMEKEEEVEPILSKIWDLHDKLSDAIHSISRTHFLSNSKKKTTTTTTTQHHHNHQHSPGSGRAGNGFVYVKGEFNNEKESAVAEAKSLNGIRSALENLEDQLEFFHTVQIQQKAERDAALARLEQSRIILALRLGEHKGKRYKVIEEALEFVGDAQEGTCFVSPDDLSGPSPTVPRDGRTRKTGNSNYLVRFLLSSLGCATSALKLDTVGGVLGNAALFAISMLAMFHIHQVRDIDRYRLTIDPKRDRTSKKVSQLDVLSARG